MRDCASPQPSGLIPQHNHQDPRCLYSLFRLTSRTYPSNKGRRRWKEGGIEIYPPISSETILVSRRDKTGFYPVGRTELCFILQAVIRFTAVHFHAVDSLSAQTTRGGGPTSCLREKKRPKGRGFMDPHPNSEKPSAESPRPTFGRYRRIHTERLTR